MHLSCTVSNLFLVVNCWYVSHAVHCFTHLTKHLVVHLTAWVEDMATILIIIRNIPILAAYCVNFILIVRLIPDNYSCLWCSLFVVNYLRLIIRSLLQKRLIKAIIWPQWLLNSLILLLLPSVIVITHISWCGY